MKNILVGIFCVLILVNCKSSKEFYKKNNTEIRFGTTGGFTGETITNTLRGDGYFYQLSNLKSDTIHFVKINKPDLKALDKLINKDSLSLIHQDETGNMTAFIDIVQNNKVLYAYKWPIGVKLQSIYLNQLYQKLISLNRTQ
ncbi:MAG: hypothetical protein IT245_01990 [Bacteroidia bacterium]|nr:hypothetical protein [Bacteroidia bacterium]